MVNIKKEDMNMYLRVSRIVGMEHRWRLSKPKTKWELLEVLGGAGFYFLKTGFFLN